MGQTTAVSGAGTVLKIGNGAGTEVFTAIGQCLKIDYSGPNKGTIETTSQDSAGWRSWISGLMDAGEVKLSINFTLANYQKLWDFIQTAAAKNVQLVAPDTGSTTIQCAAIATATSVSAPVDDRITCDFTLKFTGVPTLTS